MKRHFISGATAIALAIFASNNHAYAQGPVQDSKSLYNGIGDFICYAQRWRAAGGNTPLPSKITFRSMINDRAVEVQVRGDIVDGTQTEGFSYLALSSLADGELAVFDSEFVSIKNASFYAQNKALSFLQNPTQTFSLASYHCGPNQSTQGELHKKMAETVRLSILAFANTENVKQTTLKLAWFNVSDPGVYATLGAVKKPFVTFYVSTRTTIDPTGDAYLKTKSFPVSVVTDAELTNRIDRQLSAALP